MQSAILKYDVGNKKWGNEKLHLSMTYLWHFLLNISKEKLAYHSEESKKIWKFLDTWYQQSFTSMFMAMYSLISEEVLIDERSSLCVSIKYNRLKDKWHATSSWILWQYSSDVGKSEVWRLSRFVCFHKSSILWYTMRKTKGLRDDTSGNTNSYRCFVSYIVIVGKTEFILWLASK